MKIDADRSGLASVARLVAAAASGEPADKGKIAASMRVSVDEHDLVLSASNPHFALMCRCPVSVVEPGIRVVPAATFAESVSALPDKHVTVAAVGEKVRLTSGRHVSNLKTLPTEEFPDLGSSDSLPTCIANIPAAALGEAFAHVIYAVTNRDIGRPSLRGINMRSMGNLITFHAADTLRMASQSVRLDEANPPFSVVIPKETAHEYLTCLSVMGHTGMVRVYVTSDKHHVTIHAENFVLRSQLIDDEFPVNLVTLMPSYRSHVWMDTEEFRAAVRTADILATHEHHTIVIRMPTGTDSPEAQQMTVESMETSSGFARRDISVIESDNTNGMVLYANARMLLDALSAIGNEPQVALHFNAPNSNFMLAIGKRDDYRCIIMPVIPKFQPVQENVDA